MKKYLIVAFIAMSVVLVSCKSTEQENATAVESVDEQTNVEQENVDSSSQDSIASLFEKADAARESAVKAGADKYYVELFNDADAKLNELKEKAADSKEDLTSQINDVNLRFLALQKAAEAKNLKGKIEENGFVEENKEAYDNAESLLAELEKVFAENADSKAMLKIADSTYDAYYAIYFNSFKKLADKERQAALEEKKSCDNVKAGVARKDEYKSITEIFKKGDSSYVTKQPEQAYLSYKDAKEKYSILAKDVSEKRAAAQQKIDEAKAKVLSVESFAEEADQVAPIGEEKIDGIEEKDSVLLEKDNFNNPDEAIIKVEDTVTEQEVK